ncbi:MAG TPA: rhodanese-like domain-containing protein [Thermoplasmata archaeon]|nr:rhodanese-like domain-containing protein [Thermoplasmata archaeon]
MKHKVILMAFLLIFSLPLYERSRANIEKPSLQEEIINVTVTEVWEMLNNESDGIQFVVDIRTFGEYFNERIATPHWYDKPFLCPLQLIEIPFFAKIFVAIFKNKEVILYCRTAHRSWIAGKIIVNSGFEGKLYNMAGGITEWKANGLPTVSGFGFGK